MQVLVNTEELSPEARAEVEHIAATRALAQKKKMAEIRSARKREASKPSPGDPSKYRRNDDQTVADGKRSIMPHDAQIVGSGN